MPDPVLFDSLESLARSLEMIRSRFQRIHRPDDFVDTEEGLIILDAISMRLQSVGEKVKAIAQKNPGFFEHYGIDPVPVIRFRDFISHHYEEADYEVLFDICKNHVPELNQKIAAALTDLKNG